MSTVVLVFSSGMNIPLSESFEAEISKRDKAVKVINVENVNLPLFHSKNESALPKDFNSVLHDLKSATSMVFVAPEYNGNVPPSFTNFLAFCSKSSKDWRELFNTKKAVVATHSGGGGAHVLMHMRMQLSFIGMNVIGREILTNYKKPVNPESLTAVVDQLLG